MAKQAGAEGRVAETSIPGREMVSRSLFNELYEDYNVALRKIAKMSACTSDGDGIEIMEIVDDIISIHERNVEAMWAKANS